MAPIRLGLLCFCAVWSNPVCAWADADQRTLAFDAKVRPLLVKYCLSCHGANKPKAGLNLEAWRGQEKAEEWNAIWQRLRSRHMPPPGQPQPTPAERERMIGWIEDVFASHTVNGQPDPGPLSPRRLNVRETMNTLRDLAVSRGAALPWRASFAPKPDGSISLYQIYPPAEHPCAFVSRVLPQDTSDGGFDTVGENLSIPPYLMGKYLRCTKILMDDLFSVKGKDTNSRYQWQLRELVERAQNGPYKKGTTPRQALENFVREFASRAFRRPATATEVQKYLQLFDLAQKKGEDFETSIRLPLQAILVSPRCVLLWSDSAATQSTDREATAPAVRPLDNHELAARLSYFLWSSVPDRDLLLLAEQGKLQDADILEQQVRRMLKDQRITTGLLNGFLCQWLQLDKLERASPDAERYAYYFQNNLGELMTRELLLFAAAILVDDRSILEFVDADWGIVCYPLAQHYGLEKFPGKKQPSNADPTWYRVAFADRQRGGVLTMGKVLTGTSQAVRTSPVHRGKWVLETILGTPPPPPPPNVNNDLPAAKEGEKHLTVRERLAQHRANPACFSCHQMIDPLGLALENFDPVGKWRDDEKGQPINASAVLSDGRDIKGVVDLKLALRERKADFVRCFTEKMLTYALGRKLEFYDMPTVKRITDAAAAEDYRFSRVVVEVARSYPFRHRRL